MLDTSCHSGVAWVKAAILLTLCSVTCAAKPPAGWSFGGPAAGYECALETEGGYQSSPAVVVSSRFPAASGFGSLMQAFKAGQYAGKRIRFSAYLASEQLQGWAGLWMRVDNTNTVGARKILAFDNMQKRPVRGTRTWQKYEIVLDVPTEATEVSIGVLMDGGGLLRLSDVRIEPVGSEVPVTIPLIPGTLFGGAVTPWDSTRPDEPKNLNFLE
ncbi:MAG TPA: hypothetical protein VG273_19335 [Bryobacteraceae bacterium]|jgi:hypothetical protein|nr:hypothetical protein [Bryobacteraceae bacterium]